MDSHNFGRADRAPESAAARTPGLVSFGGATLHTILRCQERACAEILGVLPGAWEVVRRLPQREPTPIAAGSLVCKNPRCRERYEVRQVQQANEAA